MTAFDTQITVEQGILINVIGQLRVSFSFRQCDDLFILILSLDRQ